MFRGREQTHPERGEALLMRLAEDVAELGTIEQRPSQDGRNMTMLLAPEEKAPEPAAAGGHRRAAGGRGRPARTPLEAREAGRRRPSRPRQTRRSRPPEPGEPHSRLLQ